MVKLSDVEYVFNIIIPFKTHQQKFVLGEETLHTTLDGRTVKNIFTFDGNKTIERQIEPDREVIHIREYFDNELLGESIVGDVRCKHWSIAVE